MPKQTNPGSRCPVARGEVDLSYYAARDGAWREIGIGAPARRALVDAELLRVADLAKVTREKVLGLRGFDPASLLRYFSGSQGGRMSRTSTYPNFNGNTEEAFHFYRTVFGTEFTSPIQRMSDAPRHPGGPPS